MIDMSKLTCQFLRMDLNQLSPRRRAMLWAAVVSGLLLAMLDQTIVGTALPEVVRELGGPSWYVWAFIAYLVPATVLLPVAARVSDRWGRQRVLVAGMVIFLVGSSVCAAAPTMVVLTAGRALQGAGAAALEALAFIVVSELSGAARRGAGQAAISAVMGFSFVGGPLIGGLISDHAGWRWAFLVNLPIGVAAIAMLLSVLPASFGRSEARETPLDVAGIATLSLAIGAVIIGVNRHQQLGGWADPTTGGAVLLGVVGLVAFVGTERRAVAPIIPLQLLTHRTTGRLLLAGAFATTGLYAAVLLVPRWYQLDQGTSATGSGLRIYPLLIGLLLAVNIGAVAVTRRNDVRLPLLVSGTVVLVGAGLFALLDGASPGWLPLLAMAVLGLGMGPALSGLQIGLGRTTTPAHLGAAMGTLLLGRQVIGVLALAIADAAYRGQAAAHGPAAATGFAVAGVAGVGAVVAALALAGLRDRLPDPTTSVAPTNQQPHATAQPVG
jgi:EmrB/QacA subfamily drug resistance transporter